MIIRTKLNAPQIKKDIVHRESIMNMLKRVTDYKVVQVTAPAGFGKSTAIAECIRSTQSKNAWITLEEEDNDPVIFWRYMTAALSGIAGCPDTVEDIPVNKEVISSGMMAGMLIDKLFCVPGSILIILDDYHMIKNDVIHKSLAYFTKHLPANITMIIISRNELDGGLSNAFIKEKLLRIDSGDLAFHYNEISEFYERRHITLSQEEIAILQKYTEGWAAGLVVAALSIESSGNIHETVKQLSGMNRYIERFIRDEVFNNWPEDIRSFLIQTSFLDKLSGPLCSAVIGNPEADLILRRLVAGNSLIVCLDEQNKWFRYHHLFQEFLNNKLLHEAPDLQRLLWHRAGFWYRENGFVREAVDNFINAKDYEEAFQLLSDIYPEMAKNRELNEWLRRTQRIPEGYPLGHYLKKIQTFCANAWILSEDNRVQEAIAYLEKAEKCLEKIDEKSEKEYLQAHIDLAKAFIGVISMDTEQIGNYLLQMGKTDLNQTILIGELNPGEPYMINTVYGFKGDLRKISRAYGNLDIDFSRIIGNFSAYATIIFSELYYEGNNLKEAFYAMIKGMEAIMQLYHSGATVSCFLTLARLKRSEGDMPGAFQIINEGRNKLNEVNKPFWNYYFNVATASLYLDLRDTASAEEWLDIERLSIYDSLSCSREFEYIIYAKYLIQRMRYNDALLLLNRLEVFAAKENRLRSRIQILCLMAVSYYLSKNTHNAVLTLNQAVNLGMEQGYIRIFLDELEPMEELLTDYKAWVKKMQDYDKLQYVKTLILLAGENIRSFRVKNPINRIQSVKLDELLSTRELKVLHLLTAGRTNLEISQELCITIRTVKYHNTQIYSKLGVNNKFAAIKSAREIGLID